MSATPATSVSPSPSIQEKPQSSYLFVGGLNKPKPHIVKGKGCKITIREPTGEVRDVIDGMTGAAVGALSWGDEDIIDYISEAAKEYTYQFPSIICNDAAEDLAKFYIDNSPPNAFAAALWTSSGSEANEMALKTIRQYWVEKGKPQKIKNLSRYTSYHGYTTGTLSLGYSNRSTPFQEILAPKSLMVKLPEYLPYHYKLENETDEEYSVRLLKEYEEIILKEDPETIASLTVEPVSGTSLGTPRPTKTYIYGLRKLCDKYDILMHVDEVMCGTGRMNPNGKLNTWENFLPLNEGPDLQTVGKTLGSGYVTIAGMLVSPKVRNAYLDGSGAIAGAQTYACHAFNCAVALKVQQKILSKGYTKNIYEVGNYLGEELSKMLTDPEFKIVGDVRGLGGFWTVELIKDTKTKELFPRKLDVSHMVSGACFKNGLVVMGCNDNVRDGETWKGGDFIMYAPNFTITKEDADEMVKLTRKSILEVQAKLVADGVI